MALAMTSRALTPQQVASHLQIGVRQVYRWIQEGDLPAVRLGRVYRVQQDDLIGKVEIPPRIFGILFYRASHLLYSIFQLINSKFVRWLKRDCAFHGSLRPNRATLHHSAITAPNGVPTKSPIRNPTKVRLMASSGSDRGRR